MANDITITSVETGNGRVMFVENSEEGVWQLSRWIQPGQPWWSLI